MLRCGVCDVVYAGAGLPFFLWGSVNIAFLNMQMHMHVARILEWLLFVVLPSYKVRAKRVLSHHAFLILSLILFISILGTGLAYAKQLRGLGGFT